MAEDGLPLTQPLLTYAKLAKESFDKMAAAGASAAIGMSDLEHSLDELMKSYKKGAEPKSMSPTANTWVHKRPDGSPERIRVKDMSDGHLWSWIRYFRRKWRESGFKGSDAVLDSIIQEAMVTGPAIYAEAKARNVINLPNPPSSVVIGAPPTVVMKYGKAMQTDEDRLVALHGKVFEWNRVFFDGVWSKASLCQVFRQPSGHILVQFTSPVLAQMVRANLDALNGLVREVWAGAMTISLSVVVASGVVAGTTNDDDVIGGTRRITLDD